MNKPEILYSHHLYLRFFLFFAKLYKKSTAQLGQDLFTLFFLQKRRDGYFIEIGAGDGKNISNTYLLEKEFGWSGILVEPNPVFHSSIRKLRENSILIDRPVFNQSGKLVNFICVENSPELSTISDFINSSNHDRSKFNTLMVETISFRNLLLETHAPNHIDYVSIDTEGSEYQILKDFDFEKYTVDIFTIEHNYNMEKLEKMRTLLFKQGYIHILEEISQFDAWFIRQELIVNFSLDMHLKGGIRNGA